MRALKRILLGLLALLLVAAAALAWHLHGKQPQRSGELRLPGLQSSVQVRYDDFGVPHLRAASEADLYRALGYVHAQDRLFQMEMLRRLSRGELAAVLGPKLLETDRLFRTLGIRAHADAQAAREQAAGSPASRALTAYLDGINHYQATHERPLEFELLGIPKRPFTAADSLSVTAYLAYSFAAGLRTEPLLSEIRERLGPAYLKVFDLDWHPDGVLRQQMRPGDLQDLGRLATLVDRAAPQGLPLLEGSNAWAVSGRRTASGHPLLAGDPHIQYAVPAVWYEAHLDCPGFELYGHFMALSPMALLGHNERFAWSLTMFQNDDMDLVAETGKDVRYTTRQETIEVKGQPPVVLTLRRSPHGPVVSDVLQPPRDPKAPPLAMWWTLLEAGDKPIADAFYALNRADTLPKARAAAAMIAAPGLNIVWANADGDIAWWAAAKLPRRPPGVNPAFILDGASGEADKPGFLPFEDNPQEENPARGYVMSANHQPAARVPVPGYYNLWDRAERLDSLLRDDSIRWAGANTRALQLDVQTGYSERVLRPLRPLLQGSREERALLDELFAWDGRYTVEQRAPVLFWQLVYEIAHGAMADELGEAGFANLRRTRLLEPALPRLLADPASPWWNGREAATVQQAWSRTLAHLRSSFGNNPQRWTWGRAHTLTHPHPLGQSALLAPFLNVGPFEAPGNADVPNNYAVRIGPAPWPVVYGPSARRIIDFAAPGQAQGINAVGQSGVPGDRHYADQAALHVQGRYRQEHLSEADVAAHTRGTLLLKP
ncbi:penicillin acylase family protein [Pelomonas sp. KK5]|uniref:penicillin acylase family protein n=1 Tax=Pelomonas sp. KK5 TaxID=1855730 RepID=UPI0026F425C8|nr:penicillin acylase family protein [Pelomonas sp. KK5]